METRPPAYSITTGGPQETLEFGKKLGALLGPGDVVALIGNLGAGKTWLSKGIAFSAGVPDHEYVNSPAFDIVHEYPGRFPVYHIDFYRLEGLSDEDIPWLEEYFYAEGITIVEWADRFIDRLADDYLVVEMSYGDSENERKIRVSAQGDGLAWIIGELDKK